MVALLSSPLGLAQEVSTMKEATRAASEAAAAGQWKKSVAELERALWIARQNAPLEIRAAVVVNTPQRGLGLYTPATGGALEDRRLAIYVEVANFSLRPLHDNAAERKSLGRPADGVEREAILDVEGTFFAADGHRIGTMKLGSQRFVTRTVFGVTSFGLDVKLSGKVQPGTYRVQLQVTDRVSGKRTKRSVDYVVP